jgi:hypothetical protein
MLQRFYFHLNYTDDLVVDTEGLEFADLESATVAAVQSIHELAAEDLREGKEFDVLSVRVCDADGNTLEEVSAQEVLAGIVPASAVPSMPVANRC